jgi:hypothetical protein
MQRKIIKNTGNIKKFCTKTDVSVWNFVQFHQKTNLLQRILYSFDFIWVNSANCARFQDVFSVKDVKIQKKISGLQ